MTMTERLYMTSDQLQAAVNVLQCQAEPGGDYQVILDQTLFHPQGGGQPSDSGTINGVAVIRVLNDGETVRHVTRAPLAIGPADCRVDGNARALHSRLHSAGHLIGFALEAFGWQAIKAHHWPGEARVVFAPGSAPTMPDQQGLQDRLNALIHANHARVLQLEANTRRVGFGNLPAYPCGGTHVAHLAEIGQVVIEKIKEKKGQLSVFYHLV